MSIVLDALRRGRGNQARRMHTNAAQTDAVLQTLGCRSLSPTSRSDRLKGLAAYFALAIFFAIVLWRTVIW
jgi:hypothetical protein